MAISFTQNYFKKLYASATNLSWNSGVFSLLILGAMLYGLRMQLKIASADLSLSKSVSNVTPDSGSIINFKIVVRNAGPDAATGVDVTDNWPTGLGGFPSSIMGPGTIVTNPSTVQWQNFSVPPNDSVTLSFNISISGRGGYTCYVNFAEVTASGVPDPDSSPGNGNIGEDDGSAVNITVNSSSGRNCATCSPAPPNVTIINSSCMGSCMASGGSITAPPGTPCPPGNTLQYQVNGGMWSSTVPVYDQDGPAQTIKTRCNCNFDPTQSTVESDALITDPAPAPTLDIICPQDTTVTCALLVPAPDIASVSASNSCGGEVTIIFLKDSVSISDSTCINQKVIYRKYLGMDQCNNDTVCIQKITVRDTIAPMITCPNDTMVACRSEVPVVDVSQVMATDNCEGTIFELQASLSGPNESPANASPGTGTAIVTVNTVANTMRVQISFSDLTGTTTAAHIHAATAIAYSGNAGVATTLPSFTGFPSGVTSGTYANTYDMTLASSYSPAFVTANGGTPATAFVALVAAMKVGKSYVNIHSSTFPGGEIRGFLVPEVAVSWAKDSIPAADSVCTNQLTVYRVFRATDACLNVSYCTQKIVVKDTIRPVFTVFPTDTTVICVDEVPPIAGSLGCLQCPFQDVAPFATDNCGSAIVSFTEEVSTDSTCRNKKTILRIWTATDACNNMTRDTQMIRVNDTVPPILTCRDTLRFECLIDFPAAYANVDSLLTDQGTISDNCCLDSSSFRLISEKMTAPDGMTTLTRMYSIDDCCGNSDTCVQVLQMPICFLDLALKKEIDAPTPYFASPGGTVPFKVTIYNQFAIASDSIKIIDYLPSPTSSVTSPNWVNNLDGTACLTLSRANGLLPASGLVFGDSVVVSFTVQLGMDIATAATQNIAEIYSAQDTFHHTLPDLDSSPNGIPDDETGTVDNEINDDGALDEDDQDPAPFFILRDPVCQDQLNVSLDGNCQKCITAADLLLGPTLPEENYEIQVFDASGRKLQGNCIDISYLGYKLTYKVILNVPGHLNACWGTLKVEDKAPPALRCANDTVSCFEFANLPLVATNIDNCSGDTVRILSEKWVDYGCDSSYLGYVDRTIWGSDRWQNSLTCTSRIYIKKTSLDSVACPSDFEFSCTLREQYGPCVVIPRVLKTPIDLTKEKLTPEFLLSLQKPIWEFKDGTKDWILDPGLNLLPHVNSHSVYQAASGVCKINASYTDKPLSICGIGVKIRREWLIFDWCTQTEKTCVQYLSIDDKEAPAPTDKELGVVTSSPHDCGQYVDLPALKYEDCNDVKQSYSISIIEEGVTRVLRGDLPASRVWLPVGAHTIKVRLVDACYNESEGYITVAVVDLTPPTPICIEVTQVTLDPVGCWATIKAKDLDKGSRDNCCNVLHFAVAQMDSVTYWRNYWTNKLETDCGKTAYWADKDFYEYQIERWINAYVFKDELTIDECGTSQVILRVYEACGVPRYDPHIWPCSEHQWFWYNTDQRFRIEHNWNFFDPKGSINCNYRYAIQCIEDHQKRGRQICQFTNGTPTIGGMCYAQYTGAVESLFDFCSSRFYDGNPEQWNTTEAPGSYCSQRLYNDCMVTVLVDDKQAPVVDHLEDITIYCDNTPDYAGYPECEHNERFSKWPLDLKDSKGLWHGYYGGSDFLGIHTDPADHSDPDACEYNKGWAPIYCRSWLYLDSFDQAGHVNPKDYFSTLVKVDKKRPLDHMLKSNEFTITDNCRLDDATLTVVDNGTLNGCSEGWIQRTWTIKDKCANAVTATQKIIVKHRSDFEVIFPEDKVVTCDFLNRTDTGHAGVPIIKDDECEQIGVRYSDEIFTVEDSACYKIVRTWTLIDWCVYDPNNHSHYPDVIVDDRLRANNTNRSCVYRNIKDNNDGYMTYVQIIKVIDEIPPVVTTRDTTVCVLSDNCLVDVVIPLSATDNCAAASDIRFRYFIDLNATDAVYNGRLFDPTSIDQGGTQYVKDFVFLLGAPGRHVVHVVGIDNCGNADTSSFRFEIKDCKKPTPYCYNGIATVIMPSTGQVTVWAKDLNLNSSDNCTPAADLKYSFTSDVATASRQFTCADMTSDGQNQIFEVEIWVTDKAGNQDLCKTYIKLQDNADAANSRPEGACKDTVASLASISGKLLTEDQQGVESATVQIKSATPSGIPAWKSSIDGSYQFNSIPTSGSYSISAMRDDNPMNGVSTLDLVLIQKHILGTERFTSPYKIIAADADNDQNVSAIDLIELRKLILGLYDKLPNNTSWKFVPKSHIFQDINNPWSAPNEEQITVAQGVMVKDFVGIKIGDVNATAAPHSLMGTEVRGSGSGLILEVKDRTFKTGERVVVTFTSPNFKGVSGFQGTLSIGNKQLAMDKIDPGSLDVSKNNFGRRWEEDGLITMSWNSNQSQDLDDQAVLFTMNFTAQQDGRLSEVLRIGSQHTIAESYEGKGALGNVSIRFIGQHGQEITAPSELYQNYPNPFDQRTVISFNLAELGRGTFRITDITGRTIKVIEKEWAKGYQEVWIDRREIKATGILYYSFESKAFKATKKMVLLD